MTTLVSSKTVLIEKVRVTDDTLIVDFDDGRSVSLPLAWYPRLQHGTPKERNAWRLNGAGRGVHCADGLLAGRKSGESEASFQRWLHGRGKQGVRREKPSRRKATRREAA
jgi:hypothetical protein